MATEHEALSQRERAILRCLYHGPVRGMAADQAATRLNHEGVQVTTEGLSEHFRTFLEFGWIEQRPRTVAAGWASGDHQVSPPHFRLTRKGRVKLGNVPPDDDGMKQPSIPHLVYMMKMSIRSGIADGTVPRDVSSVDELLRIAPASAWGQPDPRHELVCSIIDDWLAAGGLEDF